MQSCNGPDCSRTVVYNNSTQSISWPVGNLQSGNGLVSSRTVVFCLVIGL